MCRLLHSMRNSMRGMHLCYIASLKFGFSCKIKETALKILTFGAVSAYITICPDELTWLTGSPGSPDSSVPGVVVLIT